MKLTTFILASLAWQLLPAPGEGRRFEFTARAGEIDPAAKPHPEIDFVFEKDGKPRDIEHASVDTRVESRGKLVIWLMGHNRELFDQLDSYGMHSIQIHYAREWFPKLYSGKPPADELFLSNIRLEAATGTDASPAVDIPPPDSIMGRSFRFVKWLATENPEGKWDQFITADGTGLQWNKVILTGISHGSTTAARMAKQIAVDRVVMFSGPRDQYEAWQGLPSATPPGRFFGFSHVLDDGWIGDHYPRSWQMMQLHRFGPIVDVDNTPFPYGNSRRLITAADVKGDHGRAHNSVIPGKDAVKTPDGRPIHEEVWKYLFTSPVETTGTPVPADPVVKMNQR